jgi:uncharacterized membrane protein
MMSQMTPLEKIVRSFTVAALLGVVIILVGAIVGSTLHAGARVVTICAACGGGGMFVYGGLRGRIRGKRMIHDRVSGIDQIPEEP